MAEQAMRRHMLNPRRPDHRTHCGRPQVRVHRLRLTDDWRKVNCEPCLQSIFAARATKGDTDHDDR